MSEGQAAYATFMLLAMATMLTLRLFFPPPAGLRWRERALPAAGEALEQVVRRWADL